MRGSSQSELAISSYVLEFKKVQFVRTREFHMHVSLCNMYRIFKGFSFFLRVRDFRNVRRAHARLRTP